MNPENPTTALVKTSQSPALARVSNQLTLTDKLLTKSEEPFLIPYRKGNKWGFCDQNKNIVIDCIYSRTWPFQEGLARIYVGGELENRRFDYLSAKWVYDYAKTCNGFIDINGNIIISPTLLTGGGVPVQYLGSDNYRSKTGFAGGLAICRPDKYKNYLYGCIDVYGNFIVPDEFPSIEVSRNGLALCYTGDRSYSPNVLYNNQGDLVLKTNGYIGNVNSKLVRVDEYHKRSHTHTYYIDHKGNKVIDATFTSGRDFIEGVALVTKDSEQFLINEKGEIVKQFKKLIVSHLISRNLIYGMPKTYKNLIHVAGGRGSELDIYTIDENYVLSTNLKYNRLTYWHRNDIGNLVPVEIEDNKWIYLNPDGTPAFNKAFREARPFNEGLAAVAIRSTKLSEITSMHTPDGTYGDNEYMRNQALRLEPNLQWGFINQQGAFVINPKYSKVSDFVEGVAHVSYHSEIFSNYEGYIDKIGSEYWE